MKRPEDAWRGPESQLRILACSRVCLLCVLSVFAAGHTADLCRLQNYKNKKHK